MAGHTGIQPECSGKPRLRGVLLMLPCRSDSLWEWEACCFPWDLTPGPNLGGLPASFASSGAVQTAEDAESEATLFAG